MKAKKYPAAFLVFVMCFAMLPPCIATAENVTFTAIAGNQSNANEGYGNLFDGKKTAGNHSKWCTGTLPAYVVAKASSPVVVTGYTFTTGNDTASQSGRNPVSWTLSGCNDYDGSTKTAPEWNEIISETDNSSMPAENYKSVSFSCAGNTMSYQYYKLEITKVKNGSMLQLAELEFTYTFCEHDWEKTAETAASCTEPGSETLTCKKCSVQQTIQTPAAGHVSNGSSICPRCNKPLPVTVGESYYKDIQTAVNDAAANATVTLIGDVSINSTINISKDLTLDLNGFTVTQTGSGSVIEINGGKTFTLTDSGTGAPGAITGGKAARGGGVNMGKSCTFNLERAIISYCSATSEGGGVYVPSGSTFNMTNAVITHCEVPTNVGGGFSSFGTTTVTDSKIEYCSANYGGGIKIDGAGLTVSNSTVENCTTSKSGDGIWMTKYTGKNNETTLEVNGGNIRDNKAKIGAGVYVNTGVNFSLYSAYITDNMAAEKAGGIYSGGSSITLGETPRVTGNRISSGEDVSEKQNIVKSNIYLPSGKKISIASGGLKPYVYDPDSEYSWVDNPEIYVTAENGAADITGSCADYSEYFFSDNESYAVKYADGVMKLVDAYKVTFEWGDGRPQTVISVPKDNASTVTLPDGEPWLEGYHFAGWLLDGKDYNFKKPVTADITLTPKWVKKGETAVSINYDSFYVFDLDRKATVYLAAYKNGALIDFWSGEADYDANYALTSIKTIEETGLNTSGADKIVVLLWGDNMQPVCSSAFITRP